MVKIEAPYSIILGTMILLLIVVTFWIVVITSNRSKLKLSANIQFASLLKDELMDEIERVQKHFGYKNHTKVDKGSKFFKKGVTTTRRFMTPSQ